MPRASEVQKVSDAVQVAGAAVVAMGAAAASAAPGSMAVGARSVPREAWVALSDRGPSPTPPGKRYRAVDEVQQERLRRGNPALHTLCR